MTDRQLIIIRTLIERVMQISEQNGTNRTYIQTEPLDMPVEPAEYAEFKPIINEIDKILAETALNKKQHHRRRN